MKRKKLRLFVWEDVLSDYTSGVIFILAYNLKQAKRLLDKKYPFPWYSEELVNPYREITKPEAFAVCGGG